jgi:hypothetical protein
MIAYKKSNWNIWIKIIIYPIIVFYNWNEKSYIKKSYSSQHNFNSWNLLEKIIILLKFIEELLKHVLTNYFKLKTLKWQGINNVLR